MLTTVKEHMEIIKGLEGLGWQEILGFSNQQLLPFTKEIDTDEKRRILKQLPIEYGKKLVAYPKILSKIISLLEAGISAYRIEMFIGSADEKLFDRSYEELEAALKTEAISDRYVAVYLQYYFSSHLSEKECSTLNGNLEFLETYCDKKLQNLTPSERMVLKEPIFTGEFLGIAIAEENFFQDLGKGKVLELLKYLSKFQLPMLSKEAYRQIIKNAEELYPLLREIIPRLHKGIRSCFLTRWLENEQLLFDLNRFVRQGWISQGNFYTRAGYIQEVYRYAIKAVDRLKYYQESVLLYAVKHQKKHFLKLYEENTELFLELPWNSILFQKVFYEEYVNLNTLNFQNLKECRKIKECSAIEKTDMLQKEYTFAEIKLFAVCPDREYIRLYHKLNYRRVDDRLRVMQEVVKKRLLDKVTSEETLERVAAFLSHKPLSKWVKEELGNISGLVGMDILDLFLSWEEDRFLPVMQIGELPDKTCLSYKTGMYRKCLLSCFDSNKKIIYISYQGKIVLRAILRLTKASEEKMERENKEFQFVDFTKDTGKKEKPEQLVLFLEKAYVKGISDRLEQEMFKLLFRMVKEKAGRLNISLLISRDYFGNIPSGWFQKESRYIYISATKGKEQYLDSLGGNHGIASEGKYLKASVYHPISPEKCDYERMEGEEFSEIS